jgi:hypothetical protein
MVTKFLHAELIALFFSALDDVVPAFSDFGSQIFVFVQNVHKCCYVFLGSCGGFLFRFSAFCWQNASLYNAVHLRSNVLQVLTKVKSKMGQDSDVPPLMVSSTILV